MLKRRLIAMLLCIAMIGSMTVYAVGNDTTCTCGTENDVHAEDCALLAEPETEPEPVCTCNTENDEHTSECALYVAPVTEPEVTEPVIEPVCTCNTENDEHTSECALYVAPVTEPEVTEPVIEPVCTCGTTIAGVHAETCPLYKAPAKETKAAGPNVGDKIWIKSGSLVVKDYKNPNKDPHQLWGNYQVEIKAIIEDENGTPAWYEFNFTSYGWGEALLYGYKYVKVENTSVEEPEDTEPETGVACSCGETAPENLADHAESCPRKKYVKTLFEGKTAEEIYAAWGSYDEALQNDLLNTLKSYDNAKYEELNKLIKTDPANPEGSDSVVAEDGNTVSVSGIPEAAELKISAPDEAAMEKILDTIDAQLGGVAANVTQPQRKAEKAADKLFSYDISILNAEGNEWQPSDTPVEVTLEVPGLNIGFDQRVCVAHMHDGEVKLINASFNNAEDTISFTTDGFSAFYGFVVKFEFHGELFSMSGMSDVLLSDLMNGLSLAYTEDDVERIEFTKPDVLAVEKNEEDEWVLQSKGSFFTDEYLDIYFTDGSVISILVTDPITLYYLTDTNDQYCGPTNTVTVSYLDNASPRATHTYGSYVGNTTQIDTKKKADDGTYEIYDVYIHPGMALALDSKTYSPHGDWPGSPVTNGVYTWVCDSGASINYYVIDSSITEYKTQTIQTYTGNTTSTEACCKINLHIIPKKTAPTLVENTLSEGSKYTIKTLPITLYNYDGAEFNAYHKNLTGNKYLGFQDMSKGVSAMTYVESLPWTTGPNSGRLTTGIMKNKLDANYLPVVNHQANTDFFSTKEFAGKTVYEDVDFQFIYNKNTGYYTYSSNLNHAQFFPNGNSGTIKLYNETLSPQVIGSGQAGQSGFYPFVDINDAMKNYLHDNSHQKWDSGVLENEFAPQNALYSKDFVYTNATDSTVDMHFGLQLAADFYMPVGRQVDFNGDGENENLVYQFTGDDDLWVFIDDTLVLDLGGAHTYVNGKVDFTNQTVTLGSYTPATPDGDGWKVGTNEANKTFTFSELGITIEENQIHTLRVFYLERWGGVSNCRMHFNLPIVPANSVVVNKKLTNQDNEAMNLGTEYKFQMLTKNSSVHHENDYTATRYQNYKINNVAYKTDANGYFTLKAGEQAVFENVTQFTDVKIIEVNPDDGYQYDTSSVRIQNGADIVLQETEYTFDIATTEYQTELNKVLSFYFTNKVKTADIVVSKNLDGKSETITSAADNSGVTKDFAFNVTVKNPAGQDYLNENFTLQIDGSKTFENIPVGLDYTVTESTPVAPAGYKYVAPRFNDTDGAYATPMSYKVAVMPTGGTNPNVIDVTNVLVQLFGNLQISKDGIDPMDLPNDKTTIQSTIYVVSGTSYSGESVNMEVVIVGNDSVTINHLPIGDYSVKEKTDWSWRYTLNNTVNERTVNVQEEQTATTTFTNRRLNPSWLSGDCICSNWWGGRNDTVTERS